MKSKLFKRIAASVLAAALAAAPLVTLAETAAPAIGKAFAAMTHADAEQPAKDIKVPEGYNEHDYLKLRAFLEIEDEEGVKNGEKVRYVYTDIETDVEYDPDDPETWDGVLWDESDDSGYRVYGIEWEYFGSYYANDSNGVLYGNLDLSDFTMLEGFNCFDFQLASLNVSGCIALEWVSCPGNHLTSLDITGCTALESLDCSASQLTSLDVSGATALTELHCGWNLLTELDVSKNTALRQLECNCNQLTELDVSKNTALELLHCSDNKLTELDVSTNTALQELYFWDNQLTELDISSNTVLEAMNCDGNQLTELDVSGCTALYWLVCSSNRLTALDVSKNTELRYLDCTYNRLTEIDLGNCNISDPAKVSKISSEGNGWIGFSSDYFGPFLSAEPMPGCTFVGWYSPDGKLLGTEPVMDHWDFDTTDFIAKFSGEPIVGDGDVDGDGKTTVTDALSAIRNAMALLNLTADQAAVADMDGDGRVTVGDALMIIRIAMGL